MSEKNGTTEDFFQSLINNTFREWNDIIHNASATRADIMKMLTDPRRDLEAECGYPALEEAIQPALFAQLYNRDPIARRVTELFPKECFQVTPSVYETENKRTTEFEEAWDSLGAQLEETANYGFLDDGEDKEQEGYFKDEEGSLIWDYLLRADILSGIGSFGVMFLGFDDGESPDQPVKPKKGMKLNYIRVFSEENLQITSYNQDPTSPRYQFPQSYTITINDYRDQSSNSIGAPMSTLNVHWSRCIHICDNRVSNEIFGVPRQKPVLNNILGLRKLLCGSPEMFWKGAFYGVSLETHPQLGGTPKLDRKGLKDQMEQYMNGLQRHILTSGMTAKTLAPNVADPSAHIQQQLNSIAIAINSPMRILMGSERGELASSQDDAAWNDRIKLRQRIYLTPRLIVPFANRLIQTGVLPKPKEGFRVYWPDITSQSGQEKYQVASTMTQTIASFAQAEEVIRKIMTPYDFYVEVMKFDDETATNLLANAEKELQEYEEEQAEKQMQEQEAQQAAQSGGDIGGLPPELASLLGGGGTETETETPEEPPVTNKKFSKYNIYTRNAKDAFLIASTILKTDKELALEIVTNCMQGENSGKPGPCPEGKEKSVKSNKSKVISNEKEAEKILQSQSKVFKKITSKEIETIKSYTSDDDTNKKSYHNVNKELRECPPKYKCISKESKQSLDAIEKAISLASKIPPVLVYRGINSSKVDELIKSMKNLVGTKKSFSLPGLTSTSLSPKIAKEFMKGMGESKGKKMLITIVAKKGLYLNEKSNTYNTGEKELLLSTKAKFRVLKITGNQVSLEQIS